MARNLRQSRFRRRDDMAEDVNPSAYIVNLADCMLVLACGFMVAMMVFWNIDITNVEQLQNDSLEQVNPETILENIQSGGSYYVEAGTVYQDPNTGDLWMVRKEDGSGGENEADAGGGSSQAAITSGDEGANDADIASSRAIGAD